MSGEIKTIDQNLQFLVHNENPSSFRSRFSVDRTLKLPKRVSNTCVIHYVLHRPSLVNSWYEAPTPMTSFRFIAAYRMYKLRRCSAGAFLKLEDWFASSIKESLFDKVRNGAQMIKYTINDNRSMKEALHCNEEVTRQL